MKSKPNNGCERAMKKRIGDILIDMGFIDQDQLNMALSETQKTGKPFACDYP
jgi:hypothetical protein